MIDPHWTVVDLDPVTWRNIGHFFDPGQYIRTTRPGQKELFVLHDNGRPVNVYDSQKGARPELVSGLIDNPQLLAHDLFETEEWDRVHVINKQHIAAVERHAQTIENRSLTLDAYYHRIFELVWQSPEGYVSLPPHPGHWNYWTYSQIKDYISQISGPASLALGVLDGEKLAIGLLVEVRDGLIRLVTTFEALPLQSPLTLSAEGLDQLWDAIGSKFAPPAAVLLCGQATFDAWIAAQNKSAFIEANKTFFYRIAGTPSHD
jgi:hypothetical protein